LLTVSKMATQMASGVGEPGYRLCACINECHL
jgi:hypothetical protein